MTRAITWRPRALAASLVLLVASPALAQRSAPAGRVVSDTFWSPIMTVRKVARVYLPPSYAEGGKRYPVVYYLHGASGSENDWVAQGHIDATMDSLVRAGMPELIVVMPDGDDGWWTTWNALNAPGCARDTARREQAATYCVPWPKYDDYVARDLVAHVDSSYRTIADRGHRGIAGLSMGGYGAVTLALGYPDVFSAAASHSGVLAPLLGIPHDGLPAPSGEPADVYELHARWPAWLWPSLRLAFGQHDMFGWYARDPARMLARTERAGRAVPPLFVDVGAGDPFLEENRAFVEQARALGARVEYQEWPGTHDWRYWRAHSPQSLVWLAAHVAR
ncbi:MAG: alpha/beta hydrolase fold domain-containing protein [Gemmatimonadaceae bacterium]|nr:alpha/beta hydrolase fold domain-containing protein [Gemmatimonadaceae bacterium]